MNTRNLALIMGIILVGCSAPAGTELSAPPEKSTPLPPTTTPALIPPTPTHTPGPPTVTSAVDSNEEPEVWDLVYISDSTGWGVADEYAARIEQDLGVQVKVHDLWGGNLPVSTILDALRGKPHTWISALSEEHIDPIPYIEMAEAIVVYGNEWGSQTAEHPWVWSCYEEEPYPVCRETTSCGPETFAQYEANLAAIFEEIFAIRGGEPVILRTVDLYLPWGPLEAWRACNEEEICKQCHLNWSDAIHRVADKYGVPVAGLLKAFSGPDLNLDMPREFIMDDRHPSAKGAAAIADVLADLGYEPVAPIKTTAPFAGVQGIKTSGDYLWAWNDREIWRYREGEWSYYTAAIDNLNDVAYISDTLWAVDNSRLQYFDGNEWQEPQGIYADEIEADDESGILWILT